MQDSRLCTSDNMRYSSPMSESKNVATDDRRKLSWFGHLSIIMKVVSEKAVGARVTKRKYWIDTIKDRVSLARKEEDRGVTVPACVLTHATTFSRVTMMIHSSSPV